MRIVPLTLFAVVAAAPALGQPAPVAAPDPADVAAAAVTPVEPAVSAVGADRDRAGPSEEPVARGKGKRRRKHKPGKVEVSGTLSALYKFRIEHNDDGQRDPDVFRLNKVVVRVAGRVDHRVGYTIEIDPRSPTIAGVLRDGYVSLHVIPGHEVRLGQQKTPFGYEGWQSSAELYTQTRSELSESLGRGVTHRDIGIGVVGKRKLTSTLRLEDAIALVNGAGFGVQADDTQLKNLWGRVGLRYRAADRSLELHAGLSGAIGDQQGEADPGPPPVPGVRFGFRRLGGDVEVDHRWFHLGAEAAVGWTEAPADSGMIESELAYVILVAGKSPWHAGPVVRYDTSDADGFQRVTAGGYWGEPAAPVRVLAHYEWFADDDVGTHDGRVTAEVIVRF